MQTIHALEGRGFQAASWSQPGRGMSQLANRFMEGLFQLDRLSGLYDQIRMTDDSRPFVDRALEHLDVSYNLVRGDLKDIPREGPLVVVANHPFGGIEGLILLSVLMAVRPDVKAMANQILSAIPDLQKHMILVDPFGGPGAAAQNMAPVRQCLRWLRRGGVLAMFPSGEVAHLDLAKRRICESEWHETAARLVRHSGATVLPIFFDGANGPLFQIAGLIHPRLRTAMLAREIVNKTGRPINVSLGKVIPFEKLQSFSNDAELTRYLKMRVELLGVGGAGARNRKVMKVARRREKPVLPAKPSDSLACEVAWLQPEQKLVEAGDYRVYIAQANQIPGLIREIARLREVTFRAVGEGTGQAVDLDVFDRFYQHLFVWNEKTSEVVGAYRLGLTDKIVPQYGLGGLYTRTLFKYDWDLVNSLTPAIEIGRSFVRQEYQRKHLPLLLLWKGIGTFVARNPKYRNLFGTVSMSNSYHEVSRQLVNGYFQQGRVNGVFPRLVSPRNPMRMKGAPFCDEKGQVCYIPDLDTLSEMISEVESDRKGIPVLLRQYMKLGGRVLACNVDPKFNMALDALMVVDLPRTEPRLLELYMGPLTEGYLNTHRDLKAERQERCA